MWNRLDPAAKDDLLAARAHVRDAERAAEGTVADIGRLRSRDPEAAAALARKHTEQRQEVVAARAVLRHVERDALRAAAHRLAQKYAAAAVPLVEARDQLIAANLLLLRAGGASLLPGGFTSESLLAPEGVEAPIDATDSQPARLLAPGVAERSRNLITAWNHAATEGDSDPR